MSSCIIAGTLQAALKNGFLLRTDFFDMLILMILSRRQWWRK